MNKQGRPAFPVGISLKNAGDDKRHPRVNREKRNKQAFPSFPTPSQCFTPRRQRKYLRIHERENISFGSAASYVPQTLVGSGPRESRPSPERGDHAEARSRQRALPFARFHSRGQQLSRRGSLIGEPARSSTVTRTDSQASRGSQVSPNPSPPLGQCPRNPAKRHCTSVPSLSPTLPSTPPLPSPVFVHPGNLEVVAAIFRRGDIRPCCEAQSPTAARHPGHGPFCRLPRNVSRSHRLSPTAYVAGDNFWVRDTEDAVWSTSRIRPGFLHPTTYPVLFVNFLLLLFAAS